MATNMPHVLFVKMDDEDTPYAYYSADTDPTKIMSAGQGVQRLGRYELVAEVEANMAVHMEPVNEEN